MVDNDGILDGRPKLEVVKPKEVERKFVVDRVPSDLESYDRSYIDQGYLAIEDGGNEVRLRCKSKPKQEGTFTMTVKAGTGLSRDEFETNLTFQQFHELWPGTEGRRIQKTRYKIPHSNGTIELDIYDGDLAGLITAEVEFTDEAAASEFIPPEWFGSEVTEDPAFKNQQLAINGYPGELNPSV